MAEFTSNRVARDTGARYPILQALLSWLSRSPLASAVSAAGALGMIETSPGEFEVIKAEIDALHGLTAKSFGVRLPLPSLARDDSVLDWLAITGRAS